MNSSQSIPEVPPGTASSGGGAILKTKNAHLKMSTNIAEGNGHDVFLRRAHMGQVAMSTVSSSWCRDDLGKDEPFGLPAEKQKRGGLPRHQGVGAASMSQENLTSDHRGTSTVKKSACRGSTTSRATPPQCGSRSRMTCRMTTSTRTRKSGCSTTRVGRPAGSGPRGAK